MKRGAAPMVMILTTDCIVVEPASTHAAGPGMEPESPGM
jgi:hypothetical protein